MRAASRILMAALALALGGCSNKAPARAQWTVLIATDAPLPQLGDRLLVEVLRGNASACSGCRRQFGADQARWPISFGIVPPDADGPLRVRARLYRASVTGFDGAPASDRILDAVGLLPEPDGVTTVGIPLHMACFGVTSDLDAGTTCDPTTGERGPIPTLGPVDDPESLAKPGSWAPAQPVDCEGPIESGMVCVPGGAFLLGDPDYLPLGDTDPVPEQLVQVHPFQLDVDEMTVATARTLVKSGHLTAPLAHGAGLDGYCTYADVGNDDMPVNCVSRQQAQDACTALGKRLPTEAEWEFAAGNLGLETPFPWGSGDPCDNAIVAKGDPAFVETSVACVKSTKDPIGPRAGGASLDLTALGIHNLGGNLSEWIEDDFRPYTDPECWGSDATLHIDPVCHAGGSAMTRGGDWAEFSFTAQVSVRGEHPQDLQQPWFGIRCVK